MRKWGKLVKKKNSLFKKLSRMKKDHGNGLINLKDFKGFKQWSLGHNLRVCFANRLLLESSQCLPVLQEKRMNLATSPDTGELTHDNQTRKKWISRPECHVIIKGVSRVRIDFSAKDSAFTNDNQVYTPKDFLINMKLKSQQNSIVLRRYSIK